jgi:serine O-acetyltransferase
MYDFKFDLDRYVYMGVGSWLYSFLNKQGLWALAEYRFSRWVLTEVRIPLVTKFLRLIGVLWHKSIEITTGIDLPKHSKIGKGLYIGHFGGIIVSPDVEIGGYCNLSHDVTIGVGGRGEKRGVPKVGNRVFIGPGVRIFGAIQIGDDVAIGANSVVTKDIPDRAVVMGIPAQIINFNGSEEYVSYRDLGINPSISRATETTESMVENGKF